ncbi:MAG TPA: glycosyltransferase family 39 protein [Patescibacteria group bacterium]|nr:glycosyltransferase family 39 protein [Patescibacteria group bacterium]
MKKYLILFILLAGAILRLYKLNEIPVSPYWEEVALGYDAYSISKTGRDHHGNSYPVIAFPSYGDYKPSGYFYAIVPFVKLLGLNMWSVRLPSALAGIASVGLLYLIAKELFDEQIGLLAALLFAIQPWAIQFSRGGWEVNFSLFLLLVGTWQLVLARKKPLHLIAGVIFFCLAMYTYHAARLFAPLVGVIFGILLIISWMSSLRRQGSRQQVLSLVCSFLLLIAFLFPLLSNLSNKQVSSRFTDTSIFSDVTPVLQSNAAIAAQGNTRIAKLLYHRFWYYGAIVLKQWASHFSYNFLFVRGDGNLRHSIVRIGLLYPIEAIFIIVGILFLLRTANRALLPILVWIIFAAVPAALVTPAPHALRDLYAAPAYALLSAIGIIALLRVKKTKVLVTLLVICGYFFFTARYLSTYYLVYPTESAADWQYGYKELYVKLGALKRSGEQVYVSRQIGRPAMYYLFYTAYDPATLQQKEPTLPKDQLELLQVDDYHFVDGVPSGKGLFATTGDTLVLGGKIVGNVLSLDKSIIWTIWRRE